MIEEEETDHMTEPPPAGHSVSFSLNYDMDAPTNEEIVVSMLGGAGGGAEGGDSPGDGGTPVN